MAVAWIGVDSPIGPLGVGVDGAHVCGIRFGGPPLGALAVADERFAAVLDELSSYFRGELTDFTVPVELRGGTPFERAVWDVIAGIPFGETLSYGAIARAVGEPQGAQAVGTACNHNPVPVIVGCHRVIGSDGRLVGFGGGLPRKRWLLQHEAKIWIERAFAT
jgi:methylated-DNA-[protein]-cysteine S-methyltransferase